MPNYHSTQLVCRSLTRRQLTFESQSKTLFSEIPLERATSQIHFVLKPKTRTLYVDIRIDVPMATAVNCDVCTI